MKTCSRCHKAKEDKDFYPRPDRSCGLTSACRECSVLLAKTIYKRRISRDPAYAKRYYAKHKDRYRASSILKRYRISIEECDRMLESQNGTCAICKVETPESNGKMLCIDHDHETGMVRGLLCSNCNRALGHLRESVPAMFNMIGYILGR